MDNTVLDYVLPSTNDNEEARLIEEKLKQEEAKRSEAYQNLQRELQQRREEENEKNRAFRRELLEQKKNEAEDDKEFQEEKYKQESKNDLKQKAIDTFTEPFVDKIGTSFWDTIIKGV
jgi:uncharacterized protein YqeY